MRNFNIDDKSKFQSSKYFKNICTLHYYAMSLVKDAKWCDTDLFQDEKLFKVIPTNIKVVHNAQKLTLIILTFKKIQWH